MLLAASEFLLPVRMQPGKWPEGEIGSLSTLLAINKFLELRGTKTPHISPVLSALHWIPIKHHIYFKILLITYKALNGLGSSVHERALIT